MSGYLRRRHITIEDSVRLFIKRKYTGFIDLVFNQSISK